MLIMLQKECAKHFCRFFTKKIKRQACAKNDANFIFFILLVAQLLLRTDAIPLCRVFIRYALNGTACSSNHLMDKGTINNTMFLMLNPLDTSVCNTLVVVRVVGKTHCWVPIS